jgi:protein-tyrosine phosphatase
MKNFITKVFTSSHYILKKVNIDYMMYRSDSAIDHIHDHIYLGDFRAADNLNLLQDNNVTHIINCAHGLPNQFQNDIDYLELHLHDIQSQDLTEAIEKSMEFMKNAKSNVFVHCKQGVSRSASIVIAYLITFNKMTFDEAFEYVNSKRKVVLPNPGFEMQLREYEKKVLGKKSEEEEKEDEEVNEKKKMEIDY